MMANDSFLDLIPILLLYLLTFLLLLLGFEAGYRFGILRQKKESKKEEPALNSMVGAALALMAFLLAFEMSIAVNRFDTRRLLVVDEANAIGTAFLRAGYLPEPHPNEIRSLLGELVDLRVEALITSNLKDNFSRSAEVISLVWDKTQKVVEDNPARVEITAFMDAVNEVINVTNARNMAVLTSRLPPTIILALYLVAILSIMMVGYQHSLAGKRNLFGIIALILIFTMVMMLIVDLDRPRAGLLQVSQQALLDLQQQIHNLMP
jgi:hypothetical protein